jgi:hypothetical protein
MLASKHFSIKRTAQDDWFDPILNADTDLFLDPFLVFKEGAGFWSDAHTRIIKHFDRAFLLISEGNCNAKSLQYKKAVALLIFREPRELCLGYTAKGTAGAGSGLGYARTIAHAIVEAVKRGLKHPKHFEELGILNEGIGPDRISDITCTILKERLVRYTQAIAKRHGLPVSLHQLYAGAFDERRLRWESSTLELPTNPFTNGPLVFVPKRFLRELPVINATEWWNYYEGEQLRQDMNYEIMGHVDKATIVAVARKNPGMVRKWTALKEAEKAQSYDFDRDPKGVWKWNVAAADFAQSHPMTIIPPDGKEAFRGIIEGVLDRYALFVEEQGGWDLLWKVKGSEEKPEQAAQLLFRGVAENYCRANNISLDREVNLGRGPVDFKFSNGYQQRAHLEIKKLHNGKFWNGLEQQLPSYMKSDQVADGWFVALQYRSNKTSTRRARALGKRVRELGKQKNLRLQYRLIDARPKKSASNL